MNFAQTISQGFQSPLLPIRILLGSVLLVSGVGKLIDASAAVNFLTYLFASMNKPPPIAPETLMVVLSVTEIVLALLILTGRLLKPALLVLNLMLGGFTVILAGSVGESTVPSCGCSGVFDFGMPLEMALARNIVLMVLVIVLLRLLEKEKAINTAQHP
ncbi:MAG: DoxX family protein [Candidatus Kapabacteria bacterium]|jgi:uncharacterized membrane protein YphA (DoxX/SURF4 family)|nr:DoxX family protein [Candidatus Kapabacteria bacterium]